MSGAEPDPRWQRRARPLLGTLVEVGLLLPRAPADAVIACDAAFAATAFDAAFAATAFDAAFAAVTRVQACLSRFDPGSDIARFNALAEDGWLDVQADTVAVLRVARYLLDETAGLFDVSLGSAPHGWSLRGQRLFKQGGSARIDLGGIGKGHAVDRAVAALRQAGIVSGWVNAGGDLCTFGAAQVPLKLRDEERGGVTDFGVLHDGAFATSRFDAPGHARLVRAAGTTCGSAGATRHVSVAAPSCIWADALTKVVAASGDVAHPAVARAGASAWLH
jgi:thiamine biosynthesis lipoprotein